MAQRNPPIELYRLGVAALDQALGRVASLRFLSLVHPGGGDYTAERQTRMDQHPCTVDELRDEIRMALPTTQFP